MKLVASLNSMHAKKDKLIEIAEDGIISDDEMLDFISIQKDLERVSLAVSALEVWTEKMMSSGIIDMEKYKELINK